MKSIKLFAVMTFQVVAIFLCAAAYATQPLEGEAVSGDVYVVGTIASVGSFEWDAAPTYTRLAVLRHAAAKNLRKGAITIGQASVVQVRADKARSLLDKSLKVCAQNDKTGKCTGSEKKARKLLAQAQKIILTIKVTP